MHRVHIEETGIVVAGSVAEAHGLWSRTRGLMFQRRLAPGTAIDIRPCSSIHMVFMRFPIDAVFYDRDYRVTRVARSVRPWLGIAFGGRGTWGVIELAEGAANPVKAGDALVFQPAFEPGPEAAALSAAGTTDHGRLG
jgi:uncharacterized membrane protein (UPF0127 family)